MKMDEEERETKRGMMNLLDLPEGCLSHILSLTSPVYVLRSSLVCKIFRSIAKSDLVWEKFLPSDYHLIQRSSGQNTLGVVDFPSKKYLVLHLCRSFVLLEGGNKSFALDKWTAKKCYMLGARELIIPSSGNPHCWSWKPSSESRFPEVAELLGVSQLQITGRISTQLLSPNTTYHAYFSFKLRSWSLGFDGCPVKVSVSCVDRAGAYLTGSRYNVSRTFYLKAPESNILDSVEDEEACMHRGDGVHSWLKIDMGKYFNHAATNVAVLEMTLMGVETGSYKSGLVVHGIELLPLD